MRTSYVPFPDTDLLKLQNLKYCGVEVFKITHIQSAWIQCFWFVVTSPCVAPIYGSDDVGLKLLLFINNVKNLSS
jgi:hypothetical protein